MSNSTTNLDLLSSAQLNKEIVANCLFDAGSPAVTYGRRASTTAALTWGYYGGNVLISGTPTLIANGTVTLAASTTNYVEANPADGSVSANTTGFTSGRTPLYSVVTGTSTVTSYADMRVGAAGAGLPTGGTVTSVGLSTSGVVFNVSGSPVTGSGTLTLSLISQAVNKVFAGPASGGSAAPSFRSLVPADLPVMVASGASHAAGIVPDPGSTAGTTRYLREDGTWVVPPGSATGTVTSVDLAVPGVLYSVSGGPVTTSGTLTFTLKTQTANTVFAGPTSGAAATPTMRALVAADLPVMVASGTGHAGGAVPDPGATAGTTKFLREDGSWQVPTSSGGTPGGSNTQLQFNDSGSFGGDADLTWDKTNNILTLGSATQGATITTPTGSGSVAAGNLVIGTGDAGSVTAPAGNITIQPGSNTNGGGLGTLALQGSTGPNGGTVTVKAGTATSNTGTAGALTIQGGGATGNGTHGGDVNIYGSDSSSTGGKGGTVNIKGGKCNAIAAAGWTPGPVLVTGGDGNSGTSGWAGTVGGAVTVSGGVGGGSSGGANAGAGGDVTIKGGNSGTGGNANGGNVVMTPGTGTGTGTRGNVVLNGTGSALSTSATGGFTCIPTCAGTPTGTPASIPTGTVPMVFDSTNFKLYAFVSGAWKSTAAFT